MPMNCPFCASENSGHALVCNTCSRDIAVPPSLIAERDDLIRKRDAARSELLQIREELDRLKRPTMQRSV